MKVRNWATWLSIVLVASTLVFPLESRADAKRRIAIMPFEYGSVSGPLGGYDLGKGITTLLVTKLVNDGTFSVIDRAHLDTILKEQNFSVSDRADRSTACKIGKLLGVDAIVTGTITAFGFEDKRTSMSVPSVPVPVSIPYVGGLGGFIGGMRTSSRKQTAKTAVDANVVDTNTAQILAAVHGDGESTKKGSSFGSYVCDSSDFSTSLAGEATMQAVEKLATQLVAMANKIPDNQSLALQNVEGKIADVTGNEVIVTVGKQNGLAVGDNLQVDRSVKTIKNPDTGEVIKEVYVQIAIINLKQVDKDNSTGTITRGGSVKVGDTVKKVTTDVTAIVLTPVPGAEGSGTPPAVRKTTMTTTGTVLNKEGSNPVTK